MRNDESTDGAGRSVSHGEGAASAEAPSAEVDAATEDVMRGRVAVLEEENRRLREAYARTRRSAYRRTAIGLLAVGAIAFAGGLLLPTRETVLFALGGAGVFLGILTYALTPERFVPVSVGRAVYAAMGENGASLARELGLSDSRIYVPRAGDAPDSVSLYVAQSADAEVPEPAALRNTLVVEGNSRGLAFRPTGAPLFDEFLQAHVETRRDPEAIASALADALVSQFELAGAVDPWVSPDTSVDRGQLTVAVTDSAYGSIEQFDHPVPSFVAVGLARTLDEPVAVTVADSAESDADATFTCHWPADAGARPAE